MTGEAQAWEPTQTVRSRLFGIAYRMLGTAPDAEDAVQEGFLRWERLGPCRQTQIGRPEAWLTTVISRICLDHLGSARVRREQYTGVWLPEPLPGHPNASIGVGPAPAPDPADVVTFDESISLALLVVLESLTPAERVAFILHDVFGLPFDQIAQTVGRSAHACRQLASTGRRHVAAQRRYTADGPERDRVVRAFVRACERGDVHALAQVLAPDVVACSDGGGKAGSARSPVHGADRVSRFILGILAKTRTRPDSGPGSPVLVEPVSVNGQTGLLVRVGGNPSAVVALAVADRTVARIDLVVNPDKLTRWR